MDRTTVMLPHELKIKAMEYARERGVSMGELIRDTLKKTLEAYSSNQINTDTLFTDSEIFEGNTPDDCSLNYDKYLYDDLS